MYTQNNLFKIMMILLVGSFSGLFACAPKITGFTPEKGAVGTDITVTGENFKDTASGNIVKFRGVNSTNVAVPRKNTIIAKVPAGAATGVISVTTDNGTGISSSNFIVEGVPRWTLMIYMDGDNNLEDAAINDFIEMASVGSSANLNIVVQMDRCSGYDSSYGNWTGTKRFLIKRNDTPSGDPVQSMDEQNMGDPNVLKDFVEWAVTNYPAEHYALSIWNHGGGWRMRQEKIARTVKTLNSREKSENAVARAVAWDDTDNDVLYMKEVQNALEGAKQKLTERLNTSVKLDIVGFDACLMCMVEAAYALRNVAGYFVASEQTEPWNGWPYNTILSELNNNPAMNPEDFAGLIVAKYYNSYSGNREITLAAIDVSKLNNLANKIDNFISETNSEWANLKTARNNSRVYHPAYSYSYWGMDLWDFADKVYSCVTSAVIKAAALDLKNAITEMVIKEQHSSDMNGSHGLAIYFPGTLAEFNNDPDHTGYEDNNTFMPVDFVKDYKWDNWLKDYYTNIP